MPDIHSDPGKADTGADRRPLVAAELLLTLVRSRRYHLEELVDGDGPFWISIGLFINDEHGVETGLERVIDFADESIETSRAMLKMMIERGFVQRYITSAQEEAYRLTPNYSMSFGRFLQRQFDHMKSACGAM